MKFDRTVLMFLLFVAMTLLFLYVRPNEPTSGISVEEYIYQKIYNKQKYEVVFVGDSTVESGINCDDFLATTEYSSAFNFGFGGCGFYKMYLDAAEARVDMKAENPTILLGITPHSLTEHSVNNNNFNTWSREYSADSFNYVIPPAWKYAFRPIQEFDVHAALRGEHLGYAWIMQANGWVATSRNPELDEIETVTQEDLADEENRISERVIRMLCRACERWKDKGIDVYAFLSPHAGNVQEKNLKAYGLEPAKLRSSLEKAGATWLSVPDANYHYCDGVHIHYDDAPRFTRDLAEAYLAASKR